MYVNKTKTAFCLDVKHFVFVLSHDLPLKNYYLNVKEDKSKALAEEHTDTFWTNLSRWQLSANILLQD